MTTPTKKLTINQKCAAVEEAELTGNVRATARKWKVYPSTIRKWRKNYPKIKQEAQKSPRKLTTHPGPKPQEQEVESQIYSWIICQLDAELAVSTTDIIDKALSINPLFKSGNHVTLTGWVYRFMVRNNLSVRTRTRVSQITDAAMQSVRHDFCHRLMTSYKARINDPHLLINMDETAVYLNCSPNRTVHMKGEKAVAMNIGSASSMRFTLAVTVAMDGTKLPLFVIFKGTPGGSVEKQLPTILPEGIFGCVQKKGWMDNRTMRIWYDKFYKPYIGTVTSTSGLLLDDFVCHKSGELTQRLNSDNSLLYMIPPHYTGLLQPCDVGINKSLKDQMKKAASTWRRNRHRVLAPGDKLPAPKRSDVLEWLKKIWHEFPVEIVQNSFKGCGYVFEDDVDYSMDTESESECESGNEN